MQVRRSLSALRADFRTLKVAPKELWINYIIGLLEYYAYFAIAVTLVLMLSKEFGFSDKRAGWAYGSFAMMISVAGILVGTAVDRWGVRKSLIIGTSLALVSRLIVTFTHNEWLMWLSIMVLMPLGMALVFIALPAGIKRYTNNENRTFGFSLAYVFRNVAALSALPLVDVFRSVFKQGVVVAGITLSPYRLLLLTSVLTTLLAVVLSALFVREIEVDDSGVAAFEPDKQSPWSIYSKVLRESHIWKFLLFLVFMLAVRMIFKHLDATFPKYLVRELGKGAMFGTVTSLNPFLIVLLVPLMSPLAKRIGVVRSIILGTAISGLAVLFLSIPASYATAIAFVVFLSLGESIWAPRLNEFITVASPKGREGTYLSLAAIPMFIAKFFTGGFSGYMLATYCPATGPRNCEMMWLWIAMITLSSPVLILLFRNLFKGSGFQK